MTPAQKRKITQEIKRYKKRMLDKGVMIAQRFEYGQEIQPFEKRDMIEAAHKWQVAENFENIIKGGE